MLTPLQQVIHRFSLENMWIAAMLAPYRCRWLLMQALVWLAVAAAVPVWADEPKPPTDDELIEQIVSGKKQLDEKAELDDALKTKAREYYEQALAELEKAKAAAGRIATFERRIAQASGVLDKTKTDLAALPSAVDETTLDGLSLHDIEQKISKKEAKLETRRKELAEVDGELKGRSARRAELPKLISAAQQIVAEVGNEQKADAPADANAMVQAARRLLLAARQLAAEREILACNQELKSHDARSELLPLLRDLNARQVALAESEIKLMQTAANASRQAEAEQQAQKAKREASLAHPAVKQLMKNNSELAELHKSLAERIADASRQLDEATVKLERLRSEFASVKEKVGAVGLSNVIGVMLRKWRASLPDLRSYRRNVGQRQKAMGDGELDRLERQEQRFELSDLAGQTEKALKALDLSAEDAGRLDLESAVREALETKRNYLDGLNNDYETYYDKLAKLKTAEQDLIDETEKCRQFIDERVLWIASATPLNTDEAIDSSKAFVWLAGPREWLDAGRTLYDDAWKQPILWIATMLVLLVLFFTRRRIRARIVETGEQAARGRCYQFLPTVETVALTVFSAVAWPGIVFWIGWRLIASDTADDFAKAVGAGLVIVSGVFFAQRLLRRMSCAKGLGEAHFGWSTSSLKLLRRNLRWLTLVVLPLTFGAVVMGSQGNVMWDNSLGRICFVAALAAFALFTQRVLRPTGSVFQSLITYRQNGWLDRFRYVWYPTAVLIPASLAVLAAAGYYYTAQHLAVRLAVTLCLLMGLVLLRAVLLRWILVNKRKLAIEEARKRRAVKIESTGGEETAAQLSASNEPDRDVAVIDAQTRRLVEYSLIVAALLALWFNWVDVLPALNLLNKFPVPYTSLTLADLGMAALVLATTTIAAKNIPGLLEMAILQHLPLDAGGRYAVATISRYLISIGGVIACFGALGIGWAKVQWLVAAMSLGLGFGLQEIFANFISGLIILFERPIRVGDVVTVGDVSGVVSRIRIRATTITDWDRKELVIPNKEFITGRVLNWTLTNQVNRVVIDVGVAYGSDTELATKILLGVAEKHPIVLEEPPPYVVFHSFGASSLDFVMRCYLPNLDNRQRVIHELHIAIDREFRAADIEIAFPQQDVHIRSLEVPMPSMPNMADEFARRSQERTEGSSGKAAG